MRVVLLVALVIFFAFCLLFAVRGVYCIFLPRGLPSSVWCACWPSLCLFGGLGDGFWYSVTWGRGAPQVRGLSQHPTNLAITQRSEGLQALVWAALEDPYKSRERDSKVLFAPVVVPPPRSVPRPAPLRSAVVSRRCHRSSFEDRVEQRASSHLSSGGGLSLRAPQPSVHA